MAEKAARTAKSPTFQVALEQLVPAEQRVINDPLAQRLMPAQLQALLTVCRIGPLRRLLPRLADIQVPGVVGGLLCRKRYIDERLQAALQAGITSVVILGAGFDTRAYRLPGLSSVRVYEVDLPENSEAKRTAVRRALGEEPAHVSLVGTDLNREDLLGALQSAGYSAGQPAFYIVEGVTQYIPEAAVRRTFRFLAQAAQSSQLVFTYVRRDFIQGENLYGLPVLYKQTRGRGELWQFGWTPEEIAPFLAEYGWRELEQVGSAEYQERYVQPLHRQMRVMEVERAVWAERIGTAPDRPRTVKDKGEPHAVRVRLDPVWPER
jgi:methyltransferase (TIGR00027 family)